MSQTTHTNHGVIQVITEAEKEVLEADEKFARLIQSDPLLNAIFGDGEVDGLPVADQRIMPLNEASKLSGPI